MSYTSLGDMFDGGGPGQSGSSFGGAVGGISNALGATPSGSGGGGSNSSGGLFESIGAVVGMVASGGNPMGAALGSGLGSLLSGGSMQQAFQSGVGSLMTGAALGPAGVAMNALGGSTPSTRGAQMLNAISSQQGRDKAMQQGLMGAIGGGPTGAIQGLMQGIGVQDAQGRTDPIMGGIMRELLNQQRAPRFENVMSDREMEQYSTGERLPNYRGTAAPGTPSIQYRAEGGFIEGPGTGKSDSINAAIYQNGGRVQEARLSDGEFVMTADAVKGAGNGDRSAGAAKMYQMMNQFEGMA